MENKRLESFKRIILEALDSMEFETIKEFVDALIETNTIDGTPLGYEGGGMTYPDNKDIDKLIDDIWNYLSENYKEELDKHLGIEDDGFDPHDY